MRKGHARGVACYGVGANLLLRWNTVPRDTERSCDVEACSMFSPGRAVALSQDADLEAGLEEGRLHSDQIFPGGLLQSAWRLTRQHGDLQWELYQAIVIKSSQVVYHFQYLLP